MVLVIILVVLLCGLIPAIAGIMRYERRYKEEVRSIIVDSVSDTEVLSMSHKEK